MKAWEIAVVGLILLLLIVWLDPFFLGRHRRRHHHKERSLTQVLSNTNLDGFEAAQPDKDL